MVDTEVICLDDDSRDRIITSSDNHGNTGGAMVTKAERVSGDNNRSENVINAKNLNNGESKISLHSEKPKKRKRRESRDGVGPEEENEHLKLFFADHRKAVANRRASSESTKMGSEGGGAFGGLPQSHEREQSLQGPHRPSQVSVVDLTVMNDERLHHDCQEPLSTNGGDARVQSVGLVNNSSLKPIPPCVQDQIISPKSQSLTFNSDTSSGSISASVKAVRSSGNSATHFPNQPENSSKHLHTIQTHPMLKHILPPWIHKNYHIPPQSIGAPLRGPGLPNSSWYPSKQQTCLADPRPNFSPTPAASQSPSPYQGPGIGQSAPSPSLRQDLLVGQSESSCSALSLPSQPTLCVVPNQNPSVATNRNVLLPLTQNVSLNPHPPLCLAPPERLLSTPNLNAHLSAPKRNTLLPAEQILLLAPEQDPFPGDFYTSSAPVRQMTSVVQSLSTVRNLVSVGGYQSSFVTGDAIMANVGSVSLTRNPFEIHVENSSGSSPFATGDTSPNANSLAINVQSSVSPNSRGPIAITLQIPDSLKVKCDSVSFCNTGSSQSSASIGCQDPTKVSASAPLSASPSAPAPHSLDKSTQLISTYHPELQPCRTTPTLQPSPQLSTEHSVSSKPNRPANAQSGGGEGESSPAHVAPTHPPNRCELEAGPGPDGSVSVCGVGLLTESKFTPPVAKLEVHYDEHFSSTPDYHHRLPSGEEKEAACSDVEGPSELSVKVKTEVISSEEEEDLKLFKMKVAKIKEEAGESDCCVGVGVEFQSSVKEYISAVECNAGTIKQEEGQLVAASSSKVHQARDNKFVVKAEAEIKNEIIFQVGRESEVKRGKGKMDSGERKEECGVVEVKEEERERKREVEVVVDVKPFICPHCGFGVAMKQNLEMHIKSFHSKAAAATTAGVRLQPEPHRPLSRRHLEGDALVNTDGFKCAECHFTAKDCHILKKHLQSIHEIFACVKCSFVVNNLRDLTAHLKIHKSVVCELCFTRIPAVQYQKHLNALHGVTEDTTFKCSKCSYFSNKKWKLRNHYKEAHVDGEKEAGSLNKRRDRKERGRRRQTRMRCPFVCQLCHKRLSSESSLLEHVKAYHSNSTKFSCFHCPFDGKNGNDLKEHKYKSHPDIYCFSCQLCIWKCTSQNSLDRHTSLMHKSSSLSCDSGRRSQSDCEEVADEYSPNHSGEESTSTPPLIPLAGADSRQRPSGNFECKSCNFSCTKQALMLDHELTVHKRSLPFSCKFCKYRDVSESSVLKHQVICPQRPGSKELFICPLCPFKSTTQDLLLKHKQVKHHSKLRYKCQLCSFKAVSSVELKQHFNSNHPERKAVGNNASHSSRGNIIELDQRGSSQMKGSKGDDLETKPSDGPEAKLPEIEAAAKPLRPEAEINCTPEEESEPEPEEPCSAQSDESVQSTDNKSKPLCNRLLPKIEINVDNELITEANKLHCPRCNYTSIPEFNYRVHLARWHERVLPCSHCSYVARSDRELMSHRGQTHSSLYRFKCTVCCFCSESQTDLDSHARTNHLEKMTCYRCSHVGWPSEEMNNHIRAHYKGMRFYHCHHCAYKTSDENLLSAHRDRVHQKRRCSECRACFISAIELSKHTAKEHPRSVRSCDKCSFTCTTDALYRKHMTESHHNTCTECQSSFDSALSLARHVFLWHPQLYPYSCLFCCFRGSSLSWLVAHEINHHFALTYRCTSCFFHSLRFEDLKSHLSEDHQSLRHSSLDRPPFTCSICPATAKSATFKNYKSLLSHQTGFHKTICCFCLRRMSDSAALDLHYQTDHLDRCRYKCSWCPRRFVSKTLLRSHSAISHS